MEKISSLRRQIVDFNVECERLRSELVQADQSLHSKDDRIRNLERRLDTSPVRAPPQVEDELHCLRHETETLKQENIMLRDKVHNLTTELEYKNRTRESDLGAEVENRQLKSELSDKQRENDRLLA
jgi:predicted  nucleic acid-binding Zn-ribbon protein